MKELILFDVDGVLLFSMEKAVTRLCQIIESVRLPFDMKTIESNLGHDFNGVIIPLLAEAGSWSDSQTELVALKIKYFFENTRFCSPNSLPLKLSNLKLAGYKLGLVSNRNRRMMTKALDDMEVGADLFSLIKTREDNFMKPDPRVFEDILEEFTVEKILFVGDSPICDLPAAYHGPHKIDFAAISSRIYPKERFLSAGVPENFIYGSVMEVIDELLVLRELMPKVTH
ncbi:MAG: HAD family hydrolase [Candidatus Falkowbacteria bacterium]